MTTLTEPRTKADWEEMLERALSIQDAAKELCDEAFEIYRLKLNSLNNARHATQHIRQNIIACEKAGQA